MSDCVVEVMASCVAHVYTGLIKEVVFDIETCLSAVKLMWWCPWFCPQEPHDVIPGHWVICRQG